MGRLKGIPDILSPELLHTLASMGHGDELVLADANFPTSGVCRSGPKEIRADGHKMPEILQAILTLMPLDTYVEHPAIVMEMVPGDKAKMPTPPVWSTFERLLHDAEDREVSMEQIERFEFYERAKKAFAVVATGETALYGNIILKMGVIAGK